MTSLTAPPRPRGWIEALRVAALRFNDRLSQPVFLSSAGKATRPTPRTPPRPSARFPVGTRQTG